MTRKIHIFIVIPSILLCLVQCPCLKAKETSGATIKELTATTSETHLIMFGALENSFNTEMIEVLHSGIPLRFTFYVELFKTDENWPDEQIVAHSFEHAMTL